MTAQKHRSHVLIIAMAALTLLQGCDRLSTLERRYPSTELDPWYVASLSVEVRLGVLTAIAAAEEHRDFCLFLTSERCGPCKGLLDHAERAGVRDQIDALVPVTGENYKYLRYMCREHLGVSLDPAPVVPQIVFVRGGEGRYFGGYKTGGFTADKHHRFYDFAVLLTGVESVVPLERIRAAVEGTPGP
jgi:hypothetical protein